MKKWLRILLCAVGFSAVLAISCFAYDDYSSVMQANPMFAPLDSRQYYAEFDWNDGTIAYISSSYPLHLYCVSGGGGYYYSVGSNGCTLSSSYALYVYGSDSSGSNVWGPNNPSGGWTVMWCDSSYGQPFRYHGGLKSYYTNYSIDLLDQNSPSTVLQSNFCKAPTPPLKQVIAQAGGSLLQGAFLTSGQVLPVALIVLAILLGVSLIPLVIWRFL